MLFIFIISLCSEQQSEQGRQMFVSLFIYANLIIRTKLFLISIITRVFVADIILKEKES